MSRLLRNPDYEEFGADVSSNRPDMVARHGEEEAAAALPDAKHASDADRQAIRDKFSDRAVRHGFIRKVYGLLSLQMFVLAGVSLLFTFSQDLIQVARQYWYLGLVFSLAALVFLSVILCCAPSRLLRTVPANYAILAVFTVLESLSIGFLIGAVPAYDQFVVPVALASTCAIVLVVTLFAFQTKWDVTGMGGTIFIIFMVFFSLGLIWFVVSLFVPMSDRTYNILDIVYSAVGVLVFMGVLLYHTQLLVGGSHQYALDPEDYVMAALSLYIDILNIFLFMLRIVSRSRSLAN